MISRELKQNAVNVEVAPKEPLYMSKHKQFEIMKQYTEVYKENINQDRLRREVECIKVLYPQTFRPMYDSDLLYGRLDILPIGFGSVTSVGGPGHYCSFGKLDEFNDIASVSEINEIKEFWKTRDTREVFYADHLKPNELGRFVDVLYPAIATARFSGMYLDYNLLLDNGLEGLKLHIKSVEEFKYEHQIMIEAIELIQDCIGTIHVELLNEYAKNNAPHIKKLIEVFENIQYNKPKTMIEAMQLSWLYSLCAGVVNYGRIDDYLGDYLVRDLESGEIDEETAIQYIQSLWALIEVKRTNVNGRIIIGGKGRRNPEAADLFCKLSIEATRRCRYVEPQFTLRIYDGMDEDIYKQALDCIGEGTTYPILYNDDVNIPAVMKMMNVDEETAKQYVPFGCGEFVLSGMGIGTPNTCLNVLKILDIFVNNGYDNWDGKYKLSDCKVKSVENIKNFEEFMGEYKKVLDYYIKMTGDAHDASYKVMNEQVGFILTSILTSDCIGRGKMALDGGVINRGGTNEMYGNISAANALASIKKLVFDDRQYTITELKTAIANDFEGYKEIHEATLNTPKYGNDIDYVDSIAVELHEHLCLGIANYAKHMDLDNWLVVVINNQVNTEWGRATASTLDGRVAGMYMANANNPMSGTDENGPTAMLNSLVKLKADIHAGSVQNIKFSSSMFNQERVKIEALLKTYFKNGGPQLMITIVDQKELIEAYHNPELHPNLIVRVGGFSAKFVNLEKDVQKEILDRTCNG